MSKKKKKNSNGEGSVYKDRNGYRGQIVVGIDKMGEPIRRSVSGNTKQEVNEKLTQIKYSMITGTYVSPECITLPQLTKQMLEDDLNMNFIRESSYYRHIETLKRIDETAARLARANAPADDPALADILRKTLHDYRE